MTMALCSDSGGSGISMLLFDFRSAFVGWILVDGAVANLDCHLAGDGNSFWRVSAGLVIWIFPQSEWGSMPKNREDLPWCCL